ncbi:Protein N-acetyltransferase, RimJ/RimL family [Microbulbifer donghaiensis]|uniref:Protein N-acetyltransferase, RimJ/RimL family n=1 Tax=Microbulbifer donghaiensis TaxID=494016 RepID=A0A1M5IGM7_9GAMM|nr:GNAT family N-acetyltransferase [Microbulbifer donghaiensis]SHG27100.1 Protein N-acetyltransferase, RimJ/RimL family [Microbulbifer donghaiensis]
MLIEPKTERLQLRNWRDSDRAPFAGMNADPQVMEYFPALLSRAESDAGIDRQLAHFEKYGWGFWAVERLEDGAFIGFVGIKNVTDDMPFAPAVEIGWRLGVKYWGHGYATEAARAALQVAFEQLKLPEVVSFTPLTNLRSQAVMERLGMQRDPDTFEHPLVPVGSLLRKHCLYRITPKALNRR